MPLRALAPQASASTYSATRTWMRRKGRPPMIAEPPQAGRPLIGAIPGQTGTMPPREKGPESDVVEVCRELIRIDTTNTGDPRTTVGEAAAAEYVEGFLRAAGYDPHRFCTVAGSRQGVLLRIAGRDPG